MDSEIYIFFLEHAKSMLFELLMHLGLRKILPHGLRLLTFKFKVCFAQKPTLLLSLHQSWCGLVGNI